MKNRIGFCLLILFTWLITCCVAIAQEINDQRAMQLIYGNYDVSKKYSDWNKRIVRVLASTHSEDKYVLLTEASSPDCNSHLCSAEIYAASLFNHADHWKPVSQPRLIAKMGSFGRAPEAEIAKIGPSKYGFLFHPGFTGQGITKESLVIYADTGRMYDRLLSVEGTAGDNQGNCSQELHNCWSYKSNIEFMTGKNPEYYDLLLTTTGTRPNSRKITDFKKVRRYTFHERKYHPSV